MSIPSLRSEFSGLSRSRDGIGFSDEIQFRLKPELSRPKPEVGNARTELHQGRGETGSSRENSVLGDGETPSRDGNAEKFRPRTRGYA